MECARENMVAASAHLHQSCGMPFDEITDVVVTCNGTWSKRACFTATCGVVAVAQMLDFEIKSKRCSACSQKLQTMEKTSDEFMDWWETHKSVCMCETNYEGSFPAMEAAATLDIWKRSEERLQLRFTKVISDGDLQTIAMLQESELYNKNVEITKYECVGHVQVRIGKHLRDAKWKIAALNKVARQELLEKEKEKKKEKKKGQERRSWRENRKGKRKGKRNRKVMEEVIGEGMKGEVVEKEKKVKVIKGVFSDKTIDLLQTYYGNAIHGNAIHSHVGDLEGMKRACWAVFYHSISTDDNPQHQCCPEGADSWCKYQHAVALQQDVPPPVPESLQTSNPSLNQYL